MLWLYICHSIRPLYPYIKEDLVTYFLNQEEVDFIKVDFEDRFPGKRKSPFMGTNMRYTNESLNMDEL
ncbi:conserved Plasmodium protein, unknown function [Plasmodium ovale]|uniref:Uncharacterized protein n=1 Tax=Plasmodium ovale TaxID=36330 RepID=A0A1C3KRY7_PLAOA|nr:conserved Plasmodium protein, unknown function [Plasmodium ovale]